MSSSDSYEGHWEDTPGIPYSGVDFSQIRSGVRPTLRACQYWIKGLPGICQYWLNGDPGSCEYTETDSKGRSVYPSGWNQGHCDFLGRRSFCDKYGCRNKLDDDGNETSEPDEDLEQYMCVASDPFRTGLLKEVKAGMPLRPTGEKVAVPKADIKGYNEDITTDMGRCDGCGQGKGAIGFALSNEGEDYGLDSYKKLPVVCPYYRPWHMGFGAIKPKTTDIRGATRDDKGRFIADEREELEQRLPFSFRIYNLRAKCQKCAYWDKDHGSEFILDEAGLYLESDDEDRSDFCTCTEEGASDYHTINEDAFENYEGYMLLENVWSKAGSVVCNGAKPECPCYTGDWVYCIDEKVVDGDKISAQQIMELRFWMKDWPSQEVYDKFFERKPNKDDPSTADIYTFTKWQRLSSKVSDSIMEGKEVHMCQPAPMWKTEFDSDLYLTVTDITYPKANVDIGTTVDTGNTTDIQVSFSSLVKDLEYTVVPPPLEIIYPYTTEDPFNPLTNPVCGEEKLQFVKRANSIDGDSIQIIGCTVRGKNVYAFNTYYTGIASVRELEEYDSVFSMPDAIKEDFFRRFKVFIEELIETKQKYICTGKSIGGVDADSGSFNIGPLPLKYQNLNEIIICVDYGVEGWDFRKRPVWSQWYGGAVVQTKFDSEATITVPKCFIPSASAAGKLIPFSGPNFHGCYTDASIAFSVHSYRLYSILGVIKDYYAYCIKKITMKDKEVRQWVRVGKSSIVWVEIPDINLNYIFEWKVVKGTMVFSGDAGTVCGDVTNVEMEVKYPSSWETGQKHIQPNACILEPKDKKPRNFFSSMWTLKLDYEYTMLSTKGMEGDDGGDIEELVFPTFLGARFTGSPFTVTMKGPGSFEVADIRSGTVAIMGYFTDENGRLMSTMATKMLTQVTRLECRNVEINYRYNATGKVYLLQPSSGFRTWMGADQSTGEVQVHSSRPPCGDHKCGSPCFGPMWFPFITCDTVNYYTWYAAGVSCTRPYEGKESITECDRSDYRYCGPHMYKAWTWTGGNWLAECGVLWSYYYSDALSSPVIFTGYANIVGAIDVPYYNEMGWALPHFGYGGREVVRKFLSQDFQSHITFTVYPPKVISQWMPVVPDLPNFFMSFNSFEQESSGSDYVAADYFSHVHQLNFLCSDLVKEKVNSTRLRFEDIFGVRHRALCSYPPPLYEGPKVCYLYFKDENGAWAWQERWKPIERYIDDVSLSFVSEIIKPDYKIGYYKDEHRYVCDEETHTLVYTAPVIEEGVYKTHPSISLDGAYPRYFKILYDESGYNETCVEWADENVGEVDGSGGEDEPSIYEKTAGDDWNHFKDSTTGGFLFDAEAVETTDEAADADREIVVGKDYFGEEIEKYYNRGIIVNIPRNRLKYLPYDEFLIDAPLFACSLCDGSEVYAIGDVKSTEINACVSKIVITGKIGGDVVDGKSIEFHEPSITIESLEPANWVFRSHEEGSTIDGTVSIEKTSEEFVITTKIPPTVIRMLTKKDREIRITVKPLTGYCAQITGIECFEASYVDRIETIRIWERRYVTSTLSLSGGCTSANGPDDILTYAENFDNAGQYLPILKHAEPYKCMDKMRIGAAEEGHGIGDDTPLQISMGNLHQIEAEEQMTLYNTAYDLDPSGSDDVVYTAICPIKFEQFFDDENMLCNMAGTANFGAGKISWPDHPKSWLIQYDFWRPGGHKFQWSAYTYKAKCMVLAFHMKDLYDVNAVHVDHGGEQSVLDPGNALYSGRFNHMKNVYDRFMLLAWGPPPPDRLNAHPITGWTFHT